MAIRIAVAMGGTPIGAPIVGWVADRFGPRWALGVGAASGFFAVLVAGGYLLIRKRAGSGGLSSASSPGAALAAAHDMQRPGSAEAPNRG